MAKKKQKVVEVEEEVEEESVNDEVMPEPKF